MSHRRAICSALAVTLTVLAAVVPAAQASPVLVISPPSGFYATTQGFDLVLLVAAPGLTITGGHASLDGADVTAALAACAIHGTSLPAVQTFRCPGLRGSFIGPGAHTVSITLSFSDSSTASAAVTWTVLSAP
jgi:hypothetical protein